MRKRAIKKAETESDIEAYIEEAVESFRAAITDNNDKRHALYILYNEEDGHVHTYAFNADLELMALILDSAHKNFCNTMTLPERTVH
jgi:hypothetical protein